MMLKKYLPYILLIAAAGLFWFVKSNQRGAKPQTNQIETSSERISIPAVVPAKVQPNDPEGLNRKVKKLLFSKHAQCRMACRNIDEEEVREILKTGIVNHKKIQRDKRGITYPIEGLTHDYQKLRIVFAPKNDALMVVTVIDLDTDWKCDCK